ncbi:MAG: hypothetical protein ACR2PX_05125 [Endozoicomonas sp.]|uniref:hypothetical protein n=1 Tax=Endozoicomonas sp. TaxID=1892382 RepID=UPI003D9AF1A2
MIVQLRDESLTRSDCSGEITGIIFFKLGSFQFPEQDWDDFIVTIMSWWLRALIDLKTGVSKKEELLFMEGAFSVTLEKRNASMCCLRFMKGDIRALKNIDLYPLSDLADSFLTAAQQIYLACLDRQWKSDDVDLLEKRIDQLSELYPDLGTECQG